MSQRFTLFYAGFTAYAPALYFSQLELVDLHKNEENEELKTVITEFSETADKNRDESFTHLKTAISIAKSLELEEFPQPQTNEDYLNWLNHYIDSVEREFPMGRIDHYYFLYARKISELHYNLQLLRTYIRLTIKSKTGFDFSRKIEKSTKDLEFILFKLMAAAALLSSEPRQNYFNVYYKTLCREFTPIKEIIKTELEEEKDLLNLETHLASYEIVIMDGFKKCISLLKELGI